MEHATEGTRAIALIDRAREVLAEAKTIQDVHHLVGMAAAAEVYARQVKSSQQVVDQAIELRVRAERRLGELLATTERAKPPAGPGRGNSVPEGNRVLDPDAPPTLADLGISKKESSRAQKLAAMPERVFEETISQAKSEGNLSLSRVLKKPHVAHNSGENEWYTPPLIIGAAQRVLGKIDLDPASSEIANKCVGAARIFTAETNGLERPWAGRVWMNPPYANPLIGQFCTRLLEHLSSGAVTEAIVLVNNATETAWGQALLADCSAVCLPASRVRFLTAGGEKGAPLQGQMITYHGARPEAFEAEFSVFGVVLHG